MVSSGKLEEIEKKVPYHLGCVKRALDSGELNENFVENADETHFIVNLDNDRTLEVMGDNNVKYADVVSGRDPMTMIVRITSGPNA